MWLNSQPIKHKRMKLGKKKKTDLQKLIQVSMTAYNPGN